MRKIAILFLTLLLSDVSGTVRADDVKSLTAMHGVYSGSFSEPGLPKGKVELKIRSAAAGSCTFLSWTLTPERPNAKPMHVIDIMVGKKKGTNELRFWAFGFDGIADGVASFDGKTLRMKGDTRNATYSLEGGTLTAFQSGTTDGKKVAEMRTILKRVKE